MKTNLLFISLLFLSADLTAQKFSSTSLFSKNLKRDVINEMVHKGAALSISAGELKSIFVSKPSTLELQIPFEGKVLALELEKFEPLSKSFDVIIATPSGKSEWYPYDKGLFYKGKIKGETKSLVALSFFNDEVTGVMADEKSNINIGPIKNNGYPTGDYVIYRNIDASLPVTINCLPDGSANPSTQIQKTAEMSKAATIGCPVDIYVEADYATYLSNGSNISNTVNFVATILNAVTVIYLNENITLQLREVKVWTVDDPYSGIADSRAILKQFKSNMSVGYNGELAHLVSTRNIGSSTAAVGVLCNPDPGARAGVTTTLNFNVPTSDVNTYLVAHELGHNLGSLHTHNCTWIGGAIDNCAAPEGDCVPGPPPVNGGTIMSYCPINLANGFGKQPGDKIRAELSNAPCVCNCNNMEVNVAVAITPCGSNATALITGTGEPVDFLWDNGETTATASKLTQGWHYITVTSKTASSCKIIKGINVSATTSSPSDAVLVSGNTSFCQGDSVTLSVIAQNGYQYKWFRDSKEIANATQPFLAIKTSGSYYATISNGACSFNSKSTVVTANPAPVKPSISRNDSSLISSAQTANQWFLKGTAIPGATGNTYKPITEGNYTVQLTLNGCTSAFSDVFYFQFIPKSLSEEVIVYPNPIVKNLTIANSNNRKLQIQLLNVLGQTLITLQSSNSIISLNLDNYPPAGYILSITDTDKNERIKKVLIKK